LLIGDISIQLLRGILAFALMLLPFYLLYSLLTPKGRRQLLKDVTLMVILFAIADYLRLRIEINQQPEQVISASSIQKQLPASPASAIFASTPPPGLTLAIALGISIAVAVLIVAAVWFFRRPRIISPTPLERLASEAQHAIESLQTGHSLKVTVIHCYQEMSRVVQEEKGIAREIAMTPREFEEQLISTGLPQAQIRTLTALFERVRYGNTLADSKEETLALSCLTDIVSACRSQMT
jgi:hypothetical protein